MSEIYEPAEDSYLMSDTLKRELPELLNKNPQLNLLEVGCGGGINLLTAKECGVRLNNIFGLDINNDAVDYCRKLGFNCIKSDLFNDVRGKFDVIVFNPPYLPLDKNELAASRLATTGGRKGNEIIIKFLKQAKEHLTENGRILLITSSLSPNIGFNNFGYNSKEIANKKLFFESLSVWELSLYMKQI